MNLYEYNVAKEHVIALVRVLSDEKTQTTFRQQWAVEEAASVNDPNQPMIRDRLMRRAIGWLYDGAGYGNWPERPTYGNVTEV